MLEYVPDVRSMFMFSILIKVVACCQWSLADRPSVFTYRAMSFEKPRPGFFVVAHFAYCRFSRVMVKCLWKCRLFDSFSSFSQTRAQTRVLPFIIFWILLLFVCCHCNLSVALLLVFNAPWIFDTLVFTKRYNSHVRFPCIVAVLNKKSGFHHWAW